MSIVRLIVEEKEEAGEDAYLLVQADVGRVILWDDDPDECEAIASWDVSASEVEELIDLGVIDELA